MALLNTASACFRELWLADCHEAFPSVSSAFREASTLTACHLYRVALGHLPSCGDTALVAGRTIALSVGDTTGSGWDPWTLAIRYTAGLEEHGHLACSRRTWRARPIPLVSGLLPAFVWAGQQGRFGLACEDRPRSRCLGWGRRVTSRPGPAVFPTDSSNFSTGPELQPHEVRTGMRTGLSCSSEGSEA